MRQSGRIRKKVIFYSSICKALGVIDASQYKQITGSTLNKREEN
ncbi:hypothetical protein [Mesobacillus zeae]|nr:hypothetical protein [Mesobacillus zeae]